MKPKRKVEYAVEWKDGGRFSPCLPDSTLKTVRKYRRMLPNWKRDTQIIKIETIETVVE